MKNYFYLTLILFPLNACASQLSQTFDYKPIVLMALGANELAYGFSQARDAQKLLNHIKRLQAHPALQTRPNALTHQGHTFKDLEEMKKSHMLFNIAANIHKAIGVTSIIGGAHLLYQNSMGISSAQTAEAPLSEPLLGVD